MHKSYQSTKPCASRYLQKRWDDYEYFKHQRGISNAKTTLDTSAPNTYMHLHLKPKKLQLEEERLALIERDNRILLEKIASVMRSRGCLDNQNDVSPGSLNREKRQREMLRVTRENEEIIKRILSTEPQLSRTKHEKDWQETLKTLDLMSHYPKDWWLMEKDNASESAHSTARSASRAQESERGQSSRPRSHSAGEDRPSSGGDYGAPTDTEDS